MLTLDRLEGIQLGDLDLEATPMDERRRLAILIAEAWLEMIFRHVFHGDPHPANIMVLTNTASASLTLALPARSARPTCAG